MLVPWYLMSSYGYYELDISIISDGLYDDICKRLILDWNEIEHFHKHLIDKGGLEAGTGYYIEYNLRIISAFYYLLENYT